MNRTEGQTLSPRQMDGEAMIEAMRRGVADALAEHARHGRSVVTYDLATGRIVEIPAGMTIAPAPDQDSNVL